MELRTAERLGIPVSVLGYGMWGLAGWKDTDDAEVERALDKAVKSGVTFFDTAFAYGDGRSEGILGNLIRRHETRLYTASKIPPKNRVWPAPAASPLDECFPANHIREYTERTLKNLGVEQLDLMQFHVWQDAWASDESWHTAVGDLKRDGLIRSIGLSLNRWEPWNGLAAIRTGLIDAVQVVYNVFDQSPEDELFPLCREMGVAIIARVPFDEGSLAGQLTRDRKFPEGDFRRNYFNPQNQAATMDRIERLEAAIPEGMSLPEVALRFVFSNPDVTTVIPGMRRVQSVSGNLAAEAAGPLDPNLVATLRAHRWDRKPAKQAD
ncbi:MAG: aldo/keto reductase [Vicinamibacteria bacterium]|nr:aldo/keto reductase [Vicinamibacteria bacterium]